MAKKLINIGQTANDRSGDPLRTAFNKVNENFDELYAAITEGVNFNQVNADWNASSGVARILNKPTFATVATSGSYNDLTNKPDIPSIGNVRFADTVIAADIDSSLFIGTTTTATDHNLITLGQKSIDLTVSNYTSNNLARVKVDNSTAHPVAQIVVNTASSSKTWEFNDAGNLKLPAGGAILDSTGTSVLGGATTWDSVTSKPTMFDIGGNVIGFVNIETPMSTEGTITITDTSQIDVDSESIVITKGLMQTLDDGTTTTTDSISSTLEVLGAGVRLKKTSNPDGPNNSDYTELLVGNDIYIKKAQQLAGGEEAYSSVNVSNAEVQIITNVDGLKAWSFEFSGNMTLPASGSIYDVDGNDLLGRLTNGDLSATLDSKGTLNTPLLLPKTFTAVLDEAHMVVPVTLEADPWQYSVEFAVNPDGTVQTNMDDPLYPVDPGYSQGSVFRFTEADHGIPGYTFDITLNFSYDEQVQVFSTNPSVTPAPQYPSTLKSLGAIKLTATGSTVVPGQQITAADNQGGVTNDFISVWVEGGATNYPEIVAVQPGWTVLGEGLNYVEVTAVELITQFPGAVIYRITTAISSAKMGHDYTFIEPDGSEEVPKSWVLGTDGNLTLPSTSQISGGDITIKGSSSVTIKVPSVLNPLATKDWGFDGVGRISFPDGSFQTTAASLDQLEVDGRTILTTIDDSIEIQTSIYPTINWTAAAGSGEGVFVADISAQDDIITVDSITWQVNAGTDQEPLWLAVTGTVTDPGVTFTITATGITFTEGTTYKFRNTNQTDYQWTFRSNGTLVGPGDAILSNESAVVGEGDVYRDFTVELLEPGDAFEHRLIFRNDGSLEVPTRVNVGGTMFEEFGVYTASQGRIEFGGPDNMLGVVADSNPIKLQINDLLGDPSKVWTFTVDGKLVLPGEAYANTPSSIYNSNYEIRLYPTYNGVTGLGPELSVHYDDALVITANTNDFSTSSGTRATSLKLLGATATGAMESGRVWIDSGYQPDGGPKGAVNIGTVEATTINIGNSGSTLTISGNTNAALKTTGQWAVPIGTNTYDFTVPLNGTYSMWVRANIPNGIIAWNATVTVTNNNVPAIGQQFAWNYTGAGTPIALTALPNQIEGTAGTISTTNTYVGSTANTFTFGISNTSGASQIVYWGYTKI